jgi:hypothetical protein
MDLHSRDYELLKWHLLSAADFGGPYVGLIVGFWFLLVIVFLVRGYDHQQLLFEQDYFPEAEYSSFSRVRALFSSPSLIRRQRRYTEQGRIEVNLCIRISFRA